VAVSRTSHQGFTLIELMVTIAIAAILLTIGVPSLTSFFDRQKVVAAAEDVYSNLTLARSLALSTNQPVSFKLFNYGSSAKTFGITDLVINSYATECRDGVDVDDLAVDGVIYKVTSDKLEDVDFKIDGSGTYRAMCVVFDNVRGLASILRLGGEADYIEVSYNKFDAEIHVNRMGRVNICSDTIGSYRECP